MTTPGDPLATLADAMNNYVMAQEAMREQAQQLTPSEPAFTNPPGATVGGVTNGVPSQP